MTAIRDRAQAVIATPPAPDAPGPLTAHTQLTVPAQITKGKTEKAGEFDIRQKLHETKQKVNTMVADMDAADRAHGKAKTVRDPLRAGEGTGGERTPPTWPRTWQTRGCTSRMRGGPSRRRVRRRLANQHPYRTVMGMPVDKDVDAGLKRYTAWWKTFGDELTALDRFLFTIDKQKPGRSRPRVWRTASRRYSGRS